MIENVELPYKTALSGANAKTNRMGRTKWICHKELSFASNYFILLRISFQFMNFF